MNLSTILFFSGLTILVTSQIGFILLENFDSTTPQFKSVPCYDKYSNLIVGATCKEEESNHIYHFTKKILTIGSYIIMIAGIIAIKYDLRSNGF